MKKIFVVVICYILTSCNAGTEFSRLNDVQIQDAKISKEDDKSEIKTQKMLYRGDVSGMLFLKNNYSITDVEKIVKESIEKSNVNKEYCIYGVSYFLFLTLNPWNIRFTDEQKLQRVIKYAHRNNIKGDKMTNIVYKSSWFGTPILSGSCVRVYGKIESKQTS